MRGVRGGRAPRFRGGRTPRLARPRRRQVVRGGAVRTRVRAALPIDTSTLGRRRRRRVAARRVAGADVRRCRDAVKARVRAPPGVALLLSVVEPISPHVARPEVKRQRDVEQRIARVEHEGGRRRVRVRRVIIGPRGRVALQVWVWVGSVVGGAGEQSAEVAVARRVGLEPTEGRMG